MDRKPPAQGWRASAFAVALFAITLNFLQPLAHAALMRDGGMGSALWTSMCLPRAGTDESQGTGQAVATPHQCCLGLAHATALAAPPTIFATLAPLSAGIASPLPATEVATSVGIRDGPSQPRAPPLPV
ncbi:hypothetical protein BH11PSE3_BH11PSE3_40670 [soil metagenome]